MLDTDHLHHISTELATIAGAGVEGLSPEELCDVALTVRRIRELADHVEVHTIGALEPTGHTESTTGLSAGAWFSRHARLPSSVGRTQLTIARALRHLPETDQAWLDGRITREHVRVLADASNPRIREHITELEPHLIGIAGDRTFHHWQRRISEVVARLDTEGPDPDDPTHTSATLGRSGLFANLRARFAGEDVELFEQIIEARTNDHWRINVAEHDQTSDIPLLSRPQLRAIAIMDLVLHGHPEHDLADHDDDDDESEVDDDDDAVHPNHTENDPDADDIRDDERTRDHNDNPGAPTEALIDDEPHHRHPNDEAAALTPSTKKRSKNAKKKRIKTKNPLRVGVTLVLKPEPRQPNPDNPPGTYPDIAELLKPGAGTTWKLTNLEGRELPLDRFASVLCDTDIEALVADDADNPLNLGRTKRYADATQRRIVLIRDGGCTYPGCDCPAQWVEIHHVKLWINGGFTDIIILAALCRRHHGITHRKGWTMHATEDGWFWWTTPSGHTFWSQRHGVQRTGPTPPLSADIAA